MSAARTFALQEFPIHFSHRPLALVRSPGRVNLIGEHTDYNDGFVFPLAIERGTYIAVGPRSDRQVSLYSTHFNETATFALDDLETPVPEWAEYARGVAAILQLDGFSLHGFNGVVAADLPVGAGLSSSASFSLAIARALHVTSGFTWDATKMALLCQRVENEHIGVNCGIMDQLVIAAARENQALLIDCRSLATTPASLPAEAAIVIMDTKKSRTLAGSAYNVRRAQCEAVARFFGVKALRDVTLPELEAAKSKLDPLDYQRACHVISENARTEKAGSLGTPPAAELGQLMNASHESLRNDYEVSCDELDEITALARHQPGCFGARMTGAGFGGCAVALVEANKAESFVMAVTAGYEERFHVKPALYVTRATAGTSHEML
ncbi:galactokinase [Nibricoccus aquaticus]|uniref:Galactokinase n=1 Tax=Nibricoccus aquaticus TaxID=2576891 RepID=A0A290Q4V6_9BACT|nr:galactokinase [Nibricoccus aquaticus]ATC63317.1 galactokinase [Nibricoccus aquaticus]